MWICPTFQRPERLAELAVSWERCEPGRPLQVRVWDQDPRKDDYFSIEWPEGWNLYLSSAKGAGEALNEYFRMNPNEKSYGFIGDDIVLRTPGGMKILEDAAEPWFAAYPNDVLQRHRICTHFCVGGELAKVMEGVVPPMFKHSYMDVGVAQFAEQMNLLRYCPQVIFQHMHYIVKEYGIEKDETYGIVYPNEEVVPSGEYEDYGQKALTLFRKLWLQKACQRLYDKFQEEYELWGQWEDEDVTLHSRTG